MGEIVCCVLATASRLYWQAGERWSAVKCTALMLVPVTVVFFANSGFVLSNVSDATIARAERITPGVVIARVPSMTRGP